MSYSLRKYIAGGTRFLDYVVEHCEGLLGGFLPGEVGGALQAQSLHAEAQLAI